MPAEGCDKATEEMWCCLMVREPDQEELASILPPGTEIPDVSYDFFFPEFHSARIFVYLGDRREPPVYSHVLCLLYLPLLFLHRLSRDTQRRAFRVSKFPQSAPKPFIPLAQLLPEEFLFAEQVMYFTLKI